MIYNVMQNGVPGLWCYRGIYRFVCVCIICAMMTLLFIELFKRTLCCKSSLKDEHNISVPGFVNCVVFLDSTILVMSWRTACTMRIKHAHTQFLMHESKNLFLGILF